MTLTMTQVEQTAEDGETAVASQRLSGDELRRIDAYGRANMYLAGGIVGAAHPLGCEVEAFGKHGFADRLGTRILSAGAASS